MGQAELLEPLGQEKRLRRLVEDGESGRDPDLQPVPGQHLLSEGVEGANRHVGVAVGDEEVDPFLHLGDRFVVEREGQDLRRAGPLGLDQAGDPARDHHGFPGPGAGHDQEGSASMPDGGALLGIELEVLAGL